MSTPSSTPRDAPTPLWDLPYILCPSSRPSSPSSAARVEKLISQIRNKEVAELHLICTRMKGPFGPGASRWGMEPEVPEVFDEEDLQLPDNEEQAEEWERRKRLKRDRADKGAESSAPLPHAMHVPVVNESRDKGHFPVASTTFAPYMTSTPAIASRSQSSQNQSLLNFSMSKPYLSKPHAKPRPGGLQPSSPILSSSVRASQTYPTVRSTSSLLPSKRSAPSSHTPSSSGAVMPYNSQFDLDGRVREITRILDEDAFEVDRHGGVPDD